MRTEMTRRDREHPSAFGVLVGLGFSLLGAACGGGGSDGSVDDAATGTFSEIYAAVLSTQTDSRCNFCHSMPASQVSNGKFHTGMDAAETYAALLSTTSTSDACAGRSVVVPGDPEQSLLFLKIAGQPPCGNRMPLGGSALTTAQVEMIRSWIAAGANED
jgi:hypothetical protein